jgi:hypothetical protein
LDNLAGSVPSGTDGNFRGTVMFRSFKSRAGLLVLTAMVVGAPVVLAGPADADRVYLSGHYNLTALDAAPLRSGFVENIHANGPTIFAHEQYVLNGAAPNTTYQVVLMVFPGDTTCSSTPAASIPTATIQTNAAGNGVAYHVFTPADANGLHGATVGGLWTVSAGNSPGYQTGCATIVLD